MSTIKADGSSYSLMNFNSSPSCEAFSKGEGRGCDDGSSSFCSCKGTIATFLEDGPALHAAGSVFPAQLSYPFSLVLVGLKEAMMLVDPWLVIETQSFF